MALGGPARWGGQGSWLCAIGQLGASLYAGARRNGGGGGACRLLLGRGCFGGLRGQTTGYAPVET